MDNEEILEKLIEFGDYLSKGTVIQDVIRQFMWWIVQGFAWLVDALENVTDTILGLKVFYDNSEFQNFVEDFRPFLVILLAFSLLFIGYLLIFQKKFNREAVLTNLFVALIVIVLLGAGMEKADKFTDDAINAIGSEDGGTVATDVVKDNIVDISLFDINGWESADLDAYNNLSSKYVMDINIKSYLTKGSQITSEDDLSPAGEDILSHTVETLGDGSRKVVELEDGNWITDITKEYYYRYTVDWFNIIVTLAIIGFVLVTISIKLAKLFFELAFNYVLASLVAPADLHSGQKTKQVIQNILSIFLVTILIFLSMKVYMIGTAFLADELSGVAYLVAMLGFAMAVIDGPNIVERLFGIDAGLKSGWGALAGAFAVGKGASSATKGLSGALNAARKTTGAVGSKTMSSMAGLAGLASGFKNGKNENPTESTQGKNNSGNDGKTSTENNNGTESEGTGQENNGNPTQNNTEQNGGLHEEMAQKNNGKDAGTGKPKSLHEEMAKKGKGKNKEDKKSTGTGKGTNTTDPTPTTSGDGGKEGTETTPAPTTGGGNGTPATTTFENQESKQNNPKPSPTGGNQGTETAPTTGEGNGNQETTTYENQQSKQNNPKPSPTGGNQGTETAPTTGEGNGNQETTTYENQQSKQNNPKPSGEKTGKNTTTTSTGTGGNTSGTQETSTQQTQKSGNNSSSTGTGSGGNNTPPTPTPTTGGVSSNGSEKVNTVDNTTVVSNDNTFTEKEVTKENNHVIEENRTAGQIIKEKVSKTIRSNKTINNAKRSYQIGSNTGKSIRRNFKRKK